MTIEEIRALMAMDEPRTLELKKTTNDLKDSVPTNGTFSDNIDEYPQFQ